MKKPWYDLYAGRLILYGGYTEANPAEICAWGLGTLRDCVSVWMRLVKVTRGFRTPDHVLAVIAIGIQLYARSWPEDWS